MIQNHYQNVWDEGNDDDDNNDSNDDDDDDDDDGNGDTEMRLDR